MNAKQPIGRVAVLDIETEPNPHATAIAPRGGPSNRIALHSLTGFSMLTATETADLAWTDFALETRTGKEEYEMLFDLDAALTTAQEAGATLVTYNGLAHDLPMIRRRMIANWLFALPGLAELPAMRHRDLMVEATRGYRTSWPSLRDLCAAWSIPTDHMTVTRTGTIPSIPHRKSQVDVISTFLLLAHDLSAARENSRTVSRAWVGLADFLQGPELRQQPHLSQFTKHPLLARAKVEADLTI